MTLGPTLPLKMGCLTLRNTPLAHNCYHGKFDRSTGRAKKSIS